MILMEFVLLNLGRLLQCTPYGGGITRVPAPISRLGGLNRSEKTLKKGLRSMEMEFLMHGDGAHIIMLCIREDIVLWC